MKWRKKSAELRFNERAELAKKRSVPYKWFAWYPVRLKDKDNENYLQYVWLAYVWRRTQYDDYNNEMWTEYSLDYDSIKEERI